MKRRVVLLTNESLGIWSFKVLCEQSENMEWSRVKVSGQIFQPAWKSLQRSVNVASERNVKIHLH